MNQITATHFSSSNCPQKIEFNHTIMGAFSGGLNSWLPNKVLPALYHFGAFYRRCCIEKI
ncbi:MAG: hypothetical protein KDE33_29175 [Bacteroidetes bacterium]|nr:hypothetical protein [Bacteroidota bacterium]